MTIKAVFRVQCDGPCKGWLSLPDTLLYGDLVTLPSAERAGNWPGERAARRAALGNGWEYTGKSPWNPEGQHATAHGGTLLCPTCKLTPPVRLDIRIPKAAPCLGTHDTWMACSVCCPDGVPGQLDPDDDGTDACGHGDNPDETCEGCYG